MSIIKGTRSVSGPPAPTSSKRREYPSPDGKWTLTYHSPREFHMGANGWQMKLRHRGHLLPSPHRNLSKLAGEEGFRCEDDLQPWSHDSRALVFLTWHNGPVHIYDVATKLLRPVPSGPEDVHTVQWSTGIDRLLVTCTSGALLVDQRGNQRGSATWPMGSGERPHTHWTKDGNWFFVLARASASARVMLTFYDGGDGTLGEAHELDPIDLVPYDAQPFADLPRDRFCLVVRPSIRAVGQLLDTWHGVRFDQALNTLYLAVYRPASSPYPDDSVFKQHTEWICNVEERWIAVELGS